MVTVGVAPVTFVTVEAIALNTLVASAFATVPVWPIIVGVTAASAAASAAAFKMTLFCMAAEKSSAIPVRKTQGMIDSAKIIATLPFRSRMKRRMKERSMIEPGGERKLRDYTVHQYVRALDYSLRESNRSRSGNKPLRLLRDPTQSSRAGGMVRAIISGFDNLLSLLRPKANQEPAPGDDHASQ